MGNQLLYIPIMEYYTAMRMYELQLQANMDELHELMLFLSKRSSIQIVNTIWFCLHKVQKKAKVICDVKSYIDPNLLLKL